MDFLCDLRGRTTRSVYPLDSWLNPWRPFHGAAAPLALDLAKRAIRTQLRTPLASSGVDEDQDLRQCWFVQDLARAVAR